MSDVGFVQYVQKFQNCGVAFSEIESNLESLSGAKKLRVTWDLRGRPSLRPF